MPDRLRRDAVLPHRVILLDAGRGHQHLQQDSAGVQQGKLQQEVILLSRLG